MIDSPTELKEMDLKPLPGQIRLYISLHLVQNLTHSQVLELCETLGFKPEIRHRVWNLCGNYEVGIYAVLHEEMRDFESTLEAEYVTDSAFEELCYRIVPDTAVHFSHCLKGGRAIN